MAQINITFSEKEILHFFSKDKTEGFIELLQ